MITTVEQQLEFWERLGKLHDTYGLPADIIWVKLRDKEQLPFDKNGQPMESEEFAKGIKQAVAFLQSGGWRKVAESLQTTFK